MRGEEMRESKTEREEITLETKAGLYTDSR
jgi:hypothetical protein